MHPIRLVSEIYRNKWFIEPLYAMQQGSIIAGLLNGNIAASEPEADEDENKLKCFAIDAKTPTTRYGYYSGWERAPYGSVAVISVEGPLTKEDQFCGPDGMATIGRIIQQADEHPNIKAIVLRVDSPGGTVDGTETLGNIIKAVEKPIITFVDGLMASAALWVGSGTDEVWASTDTDMVGSVGVLMSFADIQPYWEKQGVVFHTVVASTSPDKVKMWEDLRAGKYDTYIKEQLDPIDEKFMNTMRENRPGVEDKHLTGKVFFARDVMGVFVDKIGTIEQAIERAAELADNKTEQDSEKSKKNISSMKQFTLLNAVLGVPSLESVDEVVSLNEDQLTEIEGALEQTNVVAAERDTAYGERDSANAARDLAVTEREAAVAEAATAVADRTTAENNLTAAIAFFDAIDGTVAAAEGPEAKAAAIRSLLAAKPGFTPVATLDDEDPEAAAADVDWNTIDNLEHNKNV